MSDDEWISTEDAAGVLGGPSPSWRVLQGNLIGARNAAGQLGILRSSLDKEVEWQRTAGPIRRAGRAIGNLLQWF